MAYLLPYLLTPFSCHLSEIRVVLLGARGSGKSSAGNTILGQGGSFEVRRRTVQWMVGAGDVAGRQVTVTLSPVSLCSPGPHALLLMVRVDRSFTGTNRRAVQEHLELITDAVWAHIIVLFNFGDWLGDTTIEQHIESEGEALQWLVEKCGNRYHVLNNRSNSGFQLRIMLLSGRNTGRSSAGNTILGREHFKVGCHATDCVEGQGKVRGETVTVLDPPGWLSVGPGSLMSPSASGVTVVLVVVNVSSSFSHTVWRTAEKHLEALGEKVWNITMVLFPLGTGWGT
uniref:AIG1-type G domain-containing protein n=1 Tax=Oncorhynchus tshawytscha TaxID=74940 RepID=A0AAZ3SDX6_ONCTS